MELGFLLYFFVVFGLGSILLLGLGTYLGWEVVNWRQRPTWSNRTRRAKATIALSVLLFTCLLVIPIRIARVTSVDALPGSYKAGGVWGTATLDIRPDGTFVETWKFSNAYNGKSEGEGVVHGTWSAPRHGWLTRGLYLEPFKGLAEYDRDRVAGACWGSVMGFGGDTVIEVDAGSDIVFRK